MKFQKKPANPAPSERRRATAVRSGPPQAFSYYSARSQSVERERRRQAIEPEAPRRNINMRAIGSFARNRFGLLVIAVAVLIGFFNLVRLSSDPKIESLNTAEASYLLHSRADYQAAAAHLLSSSVFNSNKLTVNTNKLATELQKEFPELTTVNVALPLAGHRPVFYVRTAAPRFILVSSTSQSFVVDENGRALLATVNVPNIEKLNLPVIHDESGVKLERGHVILSHRAATLVSVVVNQLKASNVAISRLTLPAAASQLNVYPAGKPYYVKFNLETTQITQQTGTYLATVAHLGKQGITPKQYIDVRVDGRVYYK